MCTSREVDVRGSGATPHTQSLKMRFQLLVVLAVANGALAGDFCNHEDAKIVLQQWSDLYNSDTSGRTQLMIGRQIFDRLFEKMPAATKVFTRVKVADMDSGEFSAHIMRVIGGLDISINSMFDHSKLASITNHLSTQHVVRSGVTKAGFIEMGKVLMCALSQLVEDFNPDMWRNCLNPILDAIAKDLPA
ncbi:Extracellular globin-2C [Lamellibrachia satsuma]|nr:Extracellular globin-2C [Lamellibrachia satsuma]